MTESVPPRGNVARPPFLVLAGIAAIALCAVVFGPALQGVYVWDDVWQVEHNPSIARADGLGRLLATDSTDSAGAHPGVLYHPLPMLTLWLQARATGMSIVAFRLGNLAIHLLCAVLLLALLRRRGIGRTVASLAALLFLVHPSVTEPVMWVVGRQDSLAALCALAALLAWPDATSRRPVRRAAAAGLLCALAFLSKEPFVVVAALLFAWTVADRVPWRRALTWLAFPVAAVVATVMLRHALAIPSTVGGPAGGFRVLATYATILWHYFAQLTAFDNGPTVVAFRPLPWPAVAASYAALAAAIVPLARAARTGGRRAALALIGTAWFLVSLAPHVVSVPAFGVYGNRYAYFPLMGLLVVGAAAADALGVHARRSLRWLALLAAALVVVVASARTAVEARAWHDDLGLFSHRLDPEDGFALQAHSNVILRRYGCQAALPELDRAVELAPRLGQAWHNLAGCLLTTGRFDEAVVAATRALALQPNDPGAEYNLGAALVFAGHTSSGIAHLETAARLNPGHVLTARLLATLRASPVSAAAPTASAPASQR